MWHWPMTAGWLNFAGLVINLLGAMILSYGAMVTPEQAKKVTAMIWGSNPAATEDRLRVSSYSKCGLALDIRVPAPSAG